MPKIIGIYQTQPCLVAQGYGTRDMKKKWTADMLLFLVFAMAFYFLTTYVDSIFLFAFSNNIDQKIFEGYSNPLDISTLIGVLALAPVALQIIEDRGSMRAKILAHRSKKAILRAAPIIAGLSAAFEAQTACRVFIDLDKGFSVIGLDDPALLVTSKWLPHFVFLIAVVSIPSLWESWLPESKKEIQMELATLDEDISSLKFERSEFFEHPVVWDLGVWRLKPTPQNQPKHGIMRTRNCIIFAVMLLIGGASIFGSGFEQWEEESKPIFLVEALFFFALFFPLIAQNRKIRIGWKAIHRGNRPSELYAAFILSMIWFVFAVGIAGVTGFGLGHCLSRMIGPSLINESGAKLLVYVLAVLVFALFVLIVWFLSAIRPDCRFGVKKPLKALAFQRMVEIFDAIEMNESRRAEYEVKLAGSDSLT